MPSTVVQFKDAISTRMAYEFLKRKICLTKIAPKAKRPVEKDWQSKFYSNVEAASEFTDHNLGLILGRASRDLTDIDLDCDEAIALAPHILPGTPWIFGRRSTPRSHYLYHCKDSKTSKFASPQKDGGMIVEIRSDGAQTIAPGSIHPSGESVQFIDRAWENYEPYNLPWDQLQQRVADLAAAVIVLRHGWADGKRDELAVALCGLMLRMKRDPDYIDQWLGAIAQCAGDEELDMRLKAEYQQKRLEKNERVPGIPSLMNILGSDLGARVVDWLGIKTLNMVHEFNQEIAVINLNGRSRILLDNGYWSDKEPQFMKVPDARTLYQSKGVIIEKKKEKLKFDQWLDSPERRSYNKVVFAPDGCKDSEYNLWKGWPIAPRDDREGCKLFLHHVKEVICCGKQEIYEYVITWLADAIQNPSVKPGIALVLQGAQGTGKSMFAEYVLAMYGKYGMISTNSEHLFGKHNFSFSNKLMVFADESCWAGNRHHASILNNMITGNSLSFEPKGIDSFSLDNFMRIMMATNDDWAVPANGIARRFCVLEVSVRKQGDYEYFDKLQFEKENEGPEALLGYLQNYKIRRNLRELPNTMAAARNKFLTIIHNDPILGWWIHRLIDGTSTNQSDKWVNEVPIDRLYREYFNHTGVKRNDRGNQTTFGMNFRKILPADTRIVRKRVNGEIVRHYSFPSLDECRKFVANELLNEPKFFEIDWGL